MVCSRIAAAEETGRAAHRTTAVCTSPQETSQASCCTSSGQTYVISVFIAALCSLYASRATQTDAADATANTPNATIYTRASGTL